MKTKNIIRNGAFVLGMLSIASCSLDTESMIELNDQTAYRNQEAVEIDLVGCYDGWQATISNEGLGMYLMAELASDQAHGGLGFSDAKNNNAIDQFDLSIAPSYNNLFNTDWENYYKAIFRCNSIIKNENVTQWDSEVGKGLVVGQARALRAILYFDLARLFGDVPLVLVPTEDNVPRTPAAEVYKAIFEDLKYAAENIPADAFPVASNSSNDGRISKYAAEAMLARVYLYYTGYYGEENEACTKQDAIDALEDVIENGGYELETNYADLFMPACTKDASTGTGTEQRAWETTYKGKHYNNGGWTGDISKEVILNLKFAATGDYNGNADGNSFPLTSSRTTHVSAPVAGAVLTQVSTLTLTIHTNTLATTHASMLQCVSLTVHVRRWASISVLPTCTLPTIRTGPSCAMLTYCSCTQNLQVLLTV